MHSPAPIRTMLPPEDLDFILAKVGKDWESLRGRNVFITGGTGFFGIWLVESFVWANRALNLDAKLHVLSRDPAVFLKKCPHLAACPALHFHPGDIRDFVFPQGEFPLVIHAAADPSARSCPSAAMEAFLTVVDGTRRVLEFAESAKVEKLLFVSSGAAYGTQPPDMAAIGENHIGAPDPFLGSSFYGEAKRASEWLCSTHSRKHGYAMNSARCFAFVGPHLPLNGPYAMGNFIRDAMAHKPIKVAGDGLAQRSYLYCADLTVWLWRILFAGQNGRAYNVGSNYSISIRELASLVAELGNGEVPPPACSKLPANRYIPDITRACQELDLHVWTPLPEAIRKTMKWLESNHSPPTPL